MAWDSSAGWPKEAASAPMWEPDEAPMQSIILIFFNYFSIYKFYMVKFTIFPHYRILFNFFFKMNLFETKRDR